MQYKYQGVTFSVGDMVFFDSRKLSDSAYIKSRFLQHKAYIIKEIVPYSNNDAKFLIRLCGYDASLHPTWFNRCIPATKASKVLYDKV